MPSFETIKPPPPPEKGIDPYLPIRADICPFCRAQRVEMFSFNGYEQGYSKAVDAYMQGYQVIFDQYEIRSMKCKSCGKEFTIDWTNGFPVPLRTTMKTNVFFQEFAIGI